MDDRVPEPLAPASDGRWQGLENLEPRLLMAAEITLLGGAVASVEIVSGDTTPVFADFTDFGNMRVSDSGTTLHTATRLFTIKNIGSTNLTLTGTPKVVISGDAAADFTVTTQPASSVVGPDGTVTFLVTFDPSAAGERNATITIANSDADEATYTFSITGIGIDMDALFGGVYAGTTTWGSGTNATNGDDILVHYALYEADGTFHETSLGGDPFGFILGTGNVIDGWHIGLPGIQPGESRTLIIPPEQAYGTSGHALAGKTLIFEVTMVGFTTGISTPPDMTLTGNDQEIANADTTPSLADGTNFGVARPGQSITQYFHMTAEHNDGTFSLIGEPYIQVLGPDASYFTVGDFVFSDTDLSFPVTFNGSADLGLYQVQILIPTTDPDESRFNFVLGVTVAPTLFDEAWYLQANPDVAADVISGAWASGYAHFVNFGQAEGRKPNAFFEESWYLAHNPDVAAEVGTTWASGFEHFVAFGQSETRSFSPYFDENVYRRLNPDIVAAIGTTWASGFEHFMAFGIDEGRDFSLYFSESYYLARNADVAAAVTADTFRSGFHHFLQFGQHENRAFDSFFDSAFYLTANPAAAGRVGASTTASAFDDFMRVGREAGLASNPFYQESFYLSQNPDIAAAVGNGDYQSGFEHFVESGQSEERVFSTLFDEAYYLAVNPDIAAAVTGGAHESGFEHFMQFGRSEGRDFAPLFDEAYYLAQNPDVAADVGTTWSTGLEHFLAAGRLEGRAFSPYYNEQVYLSANPDVAADVPGVWPTGLYHYAALGQIEGRTAV